MSNTHFPSDEDLVVATLQVLVSQSRGNSASNKEIQEGVTVLLDLPDEVFAILCSDGKTFEFRRRATWARTYLKHMRAIGKQEPWQVVSNSPWAEPRRGGRCRQAFLPRGSQSAHGNLGLRRK